MGRVPMLAAGHRQTAVRRIPDFRSRRAAMRCVAVSRRAGWWEAVTGQKRSLVNGRFREVNRAWSTARSGCILARYLSILRIDC